MPKEPPAASPEVKVVVWNVSRYDNGLYPVSKLNACEELPAEMRVFPKPERPLAAAQLEEALAGADAALIGDDPAVYSAWSTLGSRFFVAQRTGSLTVYGRHPDR
jgi:hypothetical protein